MGFFRGLLTEQIGEVPERVVAVKRAKAFHEFVFTIIQSVAVLAALEILLKKQFNYLFLLIALLAYVSLMLYLLTVCKLVVAWVLLRLGIRDDFGHALPWIFGLLSLALSVLLTFYVPNLVAEFVTANFLQAS